MAAVVSVHVGTRVTAVAISLGVRLVGAPPLEPPPPLMSDSNAAAFANPILNAASSGVMQPTLVPALSSKGVERHFSGSEQAGVVV